MVHNTKYKNCIQEITATSTLTKEKDNTKLYDISGSLNNKLSKEGDIFAKLIVKSGEITYYLKADKNLQILNPHDDNKVNYVFSKSINDNPLSMVKVNQKCFEHYVAFLQTKDLTHYRHSQRELSQQGFINKEFIQNTPDDQNFPQFKMYNKIEEESTDVKPENKTKKSRSRKSK